MQELLEEFLIPLGISQNNLALSMRVPLSEKIEDEVRQYSAASVS